MKTSEILKGTDAITSRTSGRYRPRGTRRIVALRTF